MFFFKAAPVLQFCLLASVTWAQPAGKSLTLKDAAAETKKGEYKVFHV